MFINQFHFTSDLQRRNASGCSLSYRNLSQPLAMIFAKKAIVKTLTIVDSDVTFLYIELLN